MGEESISCSFLNNSGDFLTLVFIILAVKAMFLLFSFLCHVSRPVKEKEKDQHSTEEEDYTKFSRFSKYQNSPSKQCPHSTYSQIKNKFIPSKFQKNRLQLKNPQKSQKQNYFRASSMLSATRFDKRPSEAGARFKTTVRSRTIGFAGEKLKLQRLNQNRNAIRVFIYEIVDKISKFLNLGHLVLMLRMALVDFMIPVAINVYFLYGQSFAIALNWMFSCFILTIYGVLFIYGWTVMKNTDIFLVKKYKNKHSSLPPEEVRIAKRFLTWMESRSNLKEELKLPYKYLPEIIAVGETFCCFSLVIFNNYFLLQIVPLMLLKGSIVLMHLKRRDLYTERLEYLTNITNEAVLFIISVCFVVYFFVGKGVGVQDQYKYFGNPIIWLFLSILLFNIVIGIVELCRVSQIIYKMISKARKGKTGAGVENGE